MRRDIVKTGGVCHAIAACDDCDWKEEDYQTAQRKAREHVRRAGHRVAVEVGYCYRLNPRAAREAREGGEEWPSRTTGERHR
jgi:hypothetical protein